MPSYAACQPSTTGIWLRSERSLFTWQDIAGCKISYAEMDVGQLVLWYELHVRVAAQLPLVPHETSLSNDHQLGPSKLGPC